MTTFDHILPALRAVLGAHATELPSPLLVNRDLNGRVRLVVDELLAQQPEARQRLNSLAQELTQALGPHAYPAERMVLFEPDVQAVIQGAPHFALDDDQLRHVTVVDRLTTITDWGRIAPEAACAPRIVFFSIKGGVGRSTALAATAWSLAQAGQRVLVLDLDLESPGLSSSLLPGEKRPTYGITDWLVEDLVNNGDALLDDMRAVSDLSHDGQIDVIPAHGRDPGEYVSKLGRAWMSKVGADGQRESWSQRLERLLQALEQKFQPDVILIDSRAGIDEVASACVTGLGARGVLLFALEGEQTWTGYSVLFQHWLRAGVAREIRERLQLVAAMVPELNGAEYLDALRERAWGVFTDNLYDQAPAGDLSDFSFDVTDSAAPHYPLPIRWHRSFAALRSLHDRLQDVDAAEVALLFGPLIDSVRAMTTRTGAAYADR
jgi:hypothetical protein